MNHLANELSPYLLEHASNPVNWYPWGDIPFNEAVKRDVPIFLSIGYMACHWCHVMERESFENYEIANILNENFIAIKVDREERPDIDKIYMDALLSMNGSGGWPLTMFLTPHRKPFYGGTYFPPDARFGVPGLKSVLFSVVEAWKKNKIDLLEHSNTITNHLKETIQLSNNPNIKLSIESILDKYLENFDMQYGGWGLQPKFPHAMSIDLLISLQQKSNDNIALAIIKTLDTMARGGFHDILRGGFHRYSTDQKWLVPHFEKMLYDNALLAKTYLFAGQKYGNNNYMDIARTTLEFMKNELLDKDGGFYSSLDADTDGEEGSFYIWSHEELQSSFSDEDWQFIQESLEIPSNGNFEGQLILRCKNTKPVPQILDKLKVIQDKRSRPITDDKIITDWNALAISSFARAGMFYSNKNYKEIASNNIEFIISEMMIDGRLYHSWRNGVTRQKAFLSDYANLIIALYDLLSAEINNKWLDYAYRLTSDMVDLFYFENQFFDTGSDQENLIIRPQTIEDGVVPSGWSSAIRALQNYMFFSGNTRFSDIIDNSIEKMVPLVSKYPTAYSNWIDVIIENEKLKDYVVIFQHPEDLSNAIKMESILSKWIDSKTIFLSIPPFFNETDKINFIVGKMPVNNLSTAYICRDGTCSLPLTNINELNKQLATIRK
jgi:hypothetical protein